MTESDSNNKFAGTYRRLFDTIERGLDTCSTDRLQTILEEKRNQFKLGLDVFTAASAQSRSKLTTSVTVNGKSITFSSKEKDIILKVSDITQLNEVQCVSLWDAYRQEHPKSLDNDDSTVMDVVRFYFEDRIAFLSCIGSLQRISLLKEHPFNTIASDLCRSLCEDVTINRLFSQFTRLVRSHVPTRRCSYQSWPADWAKQNLKEQKALLEIIFLFSLSTTYAPAIVLTILQEFEANMFGTFQVFSYVLDSEGEHLREQVTSICHIITISLIIAPYLTLDIKLESSGLDATLIDTPEVIAKINQIVLHIGDDPSHSILLLVWSYFVSCLRAAVDSAPETEGYEQVKLLLQGKQYITSTVLSDRSFAHSAGFDIAQERKQCIQQTDHLERTLIGRSLKLGVFDVVQSIIDSSLCDEDDVNSVGYRSVIGLMFKSLLATTRPQFLPIESYSSLIKSFCIVYKDQQELCTEFWKEDNPLLPTALGRFPVQFTQFTELLSSVAITGSYDTTHKVYEYLCKLPSITTVLNSQTNISAVVENNVPVVRAESTMKITPTLDHITGICVFKKSRGIVLSSTDDNPIVQFAECYSGWHLLISVLANSLKERGTSDVDVQDEDFTLSGGNPEAIVSILNLIHRVLMNDPKQAPTLVNHIQATAAVSGVTTPILLSVLCDILTFSTSVKPCPIPIASAAVKCINLLLPHYPAQIWSYLHTSPIVPRVLATLAPSRLAMGHVSQIQQIVANIECTTGTYDFLLSFLDLVQGLVYEIQGSWYVREVAAEGDNMTVEIQAQIDTLYTCLHYLMLQVFPSYSGWRYKKLTDRYLIGTKLVSIFIEICNYFKERPVKMQPSLNGIRNGLLEHFLYNGSTYHISPLLDTLSDGAKMADSLYAASRIKEAQLVEECTVLTLVFVKQLLQRRLENINSMHSESKLERLMFERPVDGDCSDFLLRIAKHIDYRHSIHIPIQATQVLTLLCQTTWTWTTRPDFIQHLGDMTQAHAVIRTFLETAKDASQNEVLLSAIWQLITVFLETQPGLAILFLDCGDFIMPSPKSAVRLQSQDAHTVDSAIRAAVDILQTWETLSMEKPTVISNVLRFVATFWKTAFDHYALVERTRSDSALWDVLGKIVLNPTLELETSGLLENVNLLQVDFGQEDRFDRSIRQLCCANLSKAFAMRIMAYEVHLTAGSERAKSSLGTVEALPVALKNLLSKMSDPTKLAQLRTEFVKNDFQPLLFETVKQSACSVLQTIGISDPFALIFEAPVYGSGDDDAPGELRQYGDSYLYNLRMTESRISSFYNQVQEKYNLHSKDVLVTTEIHTALNIERLCNNLLKHVVEANHNYSIVDSQIMLLRAFRTFVETGSHHLSSLIWKGSSTDALCNFICDLIKQSSTEDRKDGITLTSYSALVHVVRSLIEDWIEKNRQVLLGKDTLAKEDYTSRLTSILSALCTLLDRENLTMMQSVLDVTAISFHQPLLESALLCIYTLRGPIKCVNECHRSQVQECLKRILPIVCRSFKVLAIKAQSLCAQTMPAKEEDVENCVKDVTIVCSLLQEIISSNYGIEQDFWVSRFVRNHTFTSLLNLFYGGVDLMMREIESQIAYTDRLYTLNITPFAETALYFLLALSNIPQTAKLLVENHLFDALTNNSLKSYLQQGTLDIFIRFGDKTKRELGYVERNPLHFIWCQILKVTGCLLRTVGDMDEVLKNTVNLMQICGPQIGRSYEKANSSSESLFALTPLECLSAPMLEELETINVVFFELSTRLERIPKLATNLFTSYKDCSLLLLQRYLYFLTHPSHMKAQLYRTNQDAPVDKFMKKVNKAILTVTHNMISTLIVLTHSDYVFTALDVEWHFGNTIFYPDMHDSTDTMASFGTLVEYINAGIVMLNQSEEDQPIKEALDIIQSCSLILTSQVALWVAKPDITNAERMGIAIDNVMDIAEVLSKASVTLEKLADKDNVNSRIKLINMLQTFLNKRFFENS